MITCHEAKLADVMEILPNLRQSDRKEFRRASGAIDKPLKESVLCSDEAYTWRVDGQIVCMAGVVSKSRISGIGIPWQVGTEELVRHAKEMCKMNRVFISRWLENYKVLENYVDNENTVSQRWLKWLGFELDKPEQFGKLGHLFRRFHIERD